MAELIYSNDANNIDCRRDFMVRSHVQQCPVPAPRATIVRKLLAGACSLVLATVLVSQAASAPPPRKISGLDPFAGCIADEPATQPGTNYPDSEIEPWIEVNPANPKNLIAGWQQDRWSDGGARGLVAGVSVDGGASWARLVPPRISKCSGGIYDRATDPWVAISPNGTAYFMSLAFDNNRPDGGGGQNAMLVSRSLNGGMSWSNPIPLIVDTDGQIFNDKNSMTADPRNSNYVYAVWDRYFDFTIPPGSKAAARQPQLQDGLARARQARRMLLQRSRSGAAASLAPSLKAPAMFTRTVNGGKSWEPPKVIYDPGNDAQTLGTLIVVLPDGSLINFFMYIGPTGETRIGMQKSLDKGKTFAAPTLPLAAHATSTGTLTPDSKKLVRDANLLFDATVDRQNGNLYLVWQSGFFGRMDKVVFSMSSDGGKNWSTPVPIAMTPKSPLRLRNQSSNPAIEVGPDHKIAVTYYDFRNDKSDGRELMDFFAVFCTPSSTVECAKRANWGDGTTALKDIRLTQHSFNILDAPYASGHFLGDYMGLTRSGKTFVPAFGIADGKNRTSVYTRPFR